MNDIKKLIGDTVTKLKRDKKALLTVAVGVMGMTLVLLSELPLASGEKSTSGQEQIACVDTSLEEDTERLISKIRGVGKVSVMLTYATSQQTVWAKDSSIHTNAKGDSESELKHIIIDSQNGETGLVEKLLYPEVRGVAVVCSGGDDPVVRSEIKELLSALFNIGSNRISIAPGAAEE